MLTVFLKIVSIFSMIAVGWFASKKDVLPWESNKYLVNLILVISNPCLIISSMASQTLTGDTIRQAIEVLTGSVVFFIGAAVVAFVLVKLLRCRPLEDQGVFMVIMTAVNTGFMGFPVTKAIFGDEIFFLMVIENIILNFYLFFLAIIQLNYGQKSKASLKDVLVSLCNMSTGAVIVGTVLLIFRVEMPPILLDFFTTMGNATIPVSMIVVGIQLAKSDLLKMMKNTQLIIVSLCNLIVMPVLTFLAVNWLPLMNESKLVLVFAACFPCAVITVAISAKEGRNSDLMAEGVAVSTLFSLATLPVAAMLLMHLYC